MALLPPRHQCPAAQGEAAPSATAEASRTCLAGGMRGGGASHLHRPRYLVYKQRDRMSSYRLCTERARFGKVGCVCVAALLCAVRAGTLAGQQHPAQRNMMCETLTVATVFTPAGLGVVREHDVRHAAHVQRVVRVCHAPVSRHGHAPHQAPVKPDVPASPGSGRQLPVCGCL
jgi:hypothetical protein